MSVYNFVVIPINQHGYRTNPVFILDNKFKSKRIALLTLRDKAQELVNQTTEKYKDKMCFYKSFDIALIKDNKKEVKTFCMKWEEKK